MRQPLHHGRVRRGRHRHGADGRAGGVIVLLAAAIVVSACSTAPSEVAPVASAPATQPASPSAASTPPPAGYDVATVRQCLQNAGASTTDNDVSTPLIVASRGTFLARFASSQEIEVAVGADSAEANRLLDRLHQYAASNTKIFVSHNVVATVVAPDTPDGKALLARCLP